MPTSMTSYAGAVAAYERAARSPGAAPAPEPEQERSGDSGFAGLVKTAVNDAMEITERGEQASLAAVAGEADITQVVTAIAEAEVTLKTVVAVRDKFVDAYTEIMRMPV